MPSSPYINRFLQPDSVIPNPANPQSWNRYSYVGNNPVNFNDPSGHIPCKYYKGDNCGDPTRTSPEDILKKYGVKIKGKTWTEVEKWAAVDAVRHIGGRFASIRKNGETGAQAFTKIFGNLEFEKGSGSEDTCAGAPTGVYCKGDADITTRFIVHELAHTLDKTLNFAASGAIQNAGVFTEDGVWVTGLHIVDGKQVWERGLSGYPNTSGVYGVPDLYHGPGNWDDWNQNYKGKEYTGVAYHEEWADMFLNWAEGTFVDDPGKARDTYMTTLVTNLVSP